MLYTASCVPSTKEQIVSVPGGLVGPLTGNDVPAILLLLEKVRNRLPAGSSHWLKPRNEKDLISHFRAANVGVGIFTLDEGRLIASVLLKNLKNPESPKDFYGYTNFPRDLVRHGVWAVQSVACDPDYQGQGLATTLLENVSLPGADCLVAKISTDNTSSRTAFFRAGFNYVASGYGQKETPGNTVSRSAAEDYPVVYLSRGLH